MNASMTSPESLEQVQSNRAGQGGEKHSTGMNDTNADDNDNNNNNNDNNNNDCEEYDGLNEDNAAWLKFDQDRRYYLLKRNPHFPAEAIDGYMRAMYRDFIAQFPSMDNKYYGPNYKYFEIRWGLNNCFSPLHRLDLLTEAIEARREHLSGLRLELFTDDVLDAVCLTELEDIQKLAHFCARCPKVTSFSITEGRRACEEAKYFFHEAVAAGNECRLVSLRLCCGTMDTWSDSFVAFLQSSSLLTELNLDLVPYTDRASIQDVFLQGLTRNTSLERLDLETPEDWVVEPLGTMLMLRHQIHGCHLPRLTFQRAQDYGFTLTPQMALLLMQGVCLGSVGYLRLQDIRMNESTFIQLVETLQESAVHPHFALKILCMQNLEVHSNERLSAAVTCLMNGVPGLEDVSIIHCGHVPFAYCAGPSALRKLTFIIGASSRIYPTSTIDFERFLEHLPSSSIRILNVAIGDNFMNYIRRNPRSLDKLEQFGICCSDCDADFFGVLLKIFATSLRIVRISGISRINPGESSILLPDQHIFDKLCRRNRCIQALQSGFVEELPLEGARHISHRGLWPAALAVVYLMDVKITTWLSCFESDTDRCGLSLSNVEIPVFNVAGSVIYAFLQQHACHLGTATCERGKRQASTSIDTTEIN